MTNIYYVYILSSETGVLYVGVTNDLRRRLEEHRRGQATGFSKKHRTTRLVYFEETADILSAIAREKQIKSWRRTKKLSLIRSANLKFRDLAEDW
jgi:putative endonuclease